MSGKYPFVANFQIAFLRTFALDYAVISLHLILSHLVTGRIQPTYIFLYKGYDPVTKYHGYPSTPPLQLTAGSLKLVVRRCFLLFQGEFDSTSILVFGE